MNLSPYKITDRRTWISGNRPVNHTYTQYKNVPIELLPEAKATLKAKRVNYRIRYRGPRTLAFAWDENGRLTCDPREERARKQDCLKRFANRFTIYILD